MKKMLLLVTIMSVGALSGMENPERGRYVSPLLQGLPGDVQSIIITYLHEYSTLDDIIGVIKKTSMINKNLNTIINEMYGNQKGFTALVHVLANKFDLPTNIIAEKFNTPTAQAYLDLGDALLKAISKKYPFNKNEFENLIAKGADVNFSNDQGSLLKEAIFHSNLEAVKMLLNAGVSPDPELLTKLEMKISFYHELMPSGESENEVTTIKKMIEEALKKEQQK